MGIWKYHNIETEFDHWYSMAWEIVKAVEKVESKPRITKCFQKSRDTSASEDINSYWGKSVAVAVIGNLSAYLFKRLTDGSHTNIFVLLQSVM